MYLMYFNVQKLTCKNIMHIYTHIHTHTKLLEFLFLHLLESTTLRDTAEMQKVELEQFSPAAGDSSALHDFASRSMEFTKQVDKTER